MPGIKAAPVAAALFFTSTILLPAEAGAKDKSVAEANTLATADQADVTTRALKAYNSDTVRKGRELAEYRWKAVLANEPPQAAWLTFDSMMNDYMFNYAMKAANSDSNYPRVVHVYTPPHRWHGMDVPGSRWGGDNPDNVYRIIPIDEKAHFRLDGRQGANHPSNVSYVLVGNWETSKTLSMIENTDLEYKPDGSFSILLGPEPANGRSNYIQTKPGAKLLFIRDSLGNWDQKANALTITRLDPPDGPPLSDQQIADRTVDIALDGLPLVYYYWKLSFTNPNRIGQLTKAGQNGGLLTQRGVMGPAQLADDEAMIVTMNPSDAAYYSVVAQDYWFIAQDYANHTASLNNGQVTKNADGTVTFVVAPKDPGVHNWIDTVGQNIAPLVIRTQGLSKNPAYEPTIQTRVVKVADLRNVLPRETKWVTPAERAAQVAQRQRQIAARMADR